MTRFVQDIKLMNEANEVQVFNHMDFYYFRPHFLLVSGTSEREAIFWNICASLMRQKVGSSVLLFWFNFKETMVKDLLPHKASTTMKAFMEEQSFMKYNREIINQKNETSLNPCSPSELEESSLLWKNTKEIWPIT